MAGFRFRGFVSILLSLAFVVVVASGLVLWLAHSPQTFGIGKGVWKHLHIFLSLLMLAASITHVCLNWAILWGYFRERAAGHFRHKLELALALVLTAVAIGLASAGGHADPMARLMTMSIHDIAKQSGKSIEEILAALKKDAIEVRNSTDSIPKIAAYNNKEAGAVAAVLIQNLPEMMRPMGDGPRGPNGGH